MLVKTFMRSQKPELQERCDFLKEDPDDEDDDKEDASLENPIVGKSKSRWSVTGDEQLTRKPQKTIFGVAQVSSVRVAVPIATVAPADNPSTPPPVQKPQFITTGKAPKVLGRFTGGEANPSTKRGRGK